MISLSAGGTFKEISKANFATLQIPLPPLDVQGKIVSEIEEYQNNIDIALRSIESYQEKIKDRIADVWGE